jgi:hypothetical protein
LKMLDVWINLIDWLIDYSRFYVPLKNISLIWRRHHCRWRAAKFRPMLGFQGLWVGRDLYRATPAVTRDLDFSGLIRMATPFSRLLRHTRECGGPILTLILTEYNKTVVDRSHRKQLSCWTWVQAVVGGLRPWATVCTPVQQIHCFPVPHTTTLYYTVPI